MPHRHAKADVVPVRQQNQYNCMTTSLCMALRALGVPDEECSPRRVNKVVGAMPMQGAAWEPLLAAANHYGMRATLTLPSTVRQLKGWTDAGNPVVIAWNPEGRDWSHASLVFDVTEDDEHGFLVHVADPNIPDPDETVRVVPKKEFYSKWYEKAPQGFLVRRPACLIEREITPEGRQMMASVGRSNWDRALDTLSSKKVTDSRGKPLGVLFIDRGKVNWRPNVLQGDHLPPPQVILRDSHTTPMDDLESFADNWVKRNIKMGSERNAYEVYVDEFGMAHDDEGNTWRAGPGYGQGTYGLRNAPRAPRQRFPRPSPSVDKKKLDAMNALLAKRPGDSFLTSIRDQVARGRALSEKQLKAVRQNLYRNGLKPMADHFRMASTGSSRVAALFISKMAASSKLDRTLKSQINKTLTTQGFDGNTVFSRPERAYSQAVDIIGAYGLEMDEVVSSHLFKARPTIILNIDVAFSNPDDSFSPVSITNSVLHMQITELLPGRFEAIAYMS